MIEPGALSLANQELASSADLRRWLEALGAPESGVDDEVVLRLPEFLALRSSVRDLLEASIGGGPFPATAVERLNETSARVPRVLRLDETGSVEEAVATSRTASLLAEIARDAIGILGGPDRERLRRCPACSRFFVTTRGDRRWCAAACGNRTRVARFHARRRPP